MSEAQIYRQARFVPPPGSTELLLIRHGESAPADPAHPFPLKDGHGDPELAPEGRAQAELVADRLKDEPIDAIYISNLRRTAETAAPLASQLGIKPIVEPDLREIFLGDWEGGLLRKVAAEQHPQYLALHEHESWDPVPGGERTAAFSKRCVGAIERIVAAHFDQRVVVVAHGGTIGAILAHAASSRNFAFNGSDNASISHLVVGEKWWIRRFNDTAHLNDAIVQ